MPIDTQQPVQPRAAGGVFKLWVFIGEHEACCAESGQRAFVKSAQNQFLFARVGVDIADRKNARDAGGELFCVNFDLFARHGQAPVCQGAQLG